MSLVALIVDPDADVSSALGDLVARVGWTPTVESTFVGARREIEMQRPCALVAKVKLGMFNAIQLAYLAKMKRPEARAILYGDEADAALAAEVQAANGFYERAHLVRHSLTSYLGSRLPDKDRRNVWRKDRRDIFRGGRRVTDAHIVRRSLSPV